MDKSEMNEKINRLQQWIKTQPQLPQKIEGKFLRIFLLAKDGDLEAVKQLIHYHFQFRLKHQNLFFNRDPLDTGIQQALKVENLMQLPGRTPQNYKLFLNKLNDSDPAKYHFDDIIKTFFMMIDMYMLTDKEDYDGEMIVFDMLGVSWRHQLKVSIGTVRVFMQAVQEAYPLRVRRIHVLNANSVIHTIVRLIKPFMKSELFNMLQFHLPNSEKPYEEFPREMLPEELGGKAGKLADLRKYWIDRLMQHRDYLIDESRWKLKKM